MAVINDDSPLFSYQDDMNHIARPLFENSDIDFFCFSRIYPDNSLALLSSLPKLNRESVETHSTITYSQLENLLKNNKSINKYKNQWIQTVQ